MSTPFPFIVGCGRSGTTLLRVMFDAHPQITIPPEAYFPLRPPADWFGADGIPDADRFVESFRTRPWFERWDLPASAFPDALAQDRPRDYPELIRCLFRLYARKHSKPLYGNKTPRHVLYMPRLAALFPEARFVHIIRDGRDVALSVLEVDFGPTDLPGAARFWQGRVERGRTTGEVLGKNRYREVRYEDLVKDPEDELTRLCGFLDLPYDAAMLRYHEREIDAVAGVPMPEKHRHLSRPPTQGLRDWRSQMSEADVRLFGSVAGSTLEAFGYERGASDAGASTRVRRDVSGISSDLMKRSRRLRKRAGTSIKGILHG